LRRRVIPALTERLDTLHPKTNDWLGVRHNWLHHWLGDGRVNLLRKSVGVANEGNVCSEECWDFVLVGHAYLVQSSSLNAFEFYWSVGVWRLPPRKSQKNSLTNYIIRKKKYNNYYRRKAFEYMNILSQHL